MDTFISHGETVEEPAMIKVGPAEIWDQPGVGSRTRDERVGDPEFFEINRSKTDGHY